MRAFFRIWFVLFAIFPASVFSSEKPASPVTAVIGAMTEEVGILKTALGDQKDEKHLGLSFFRGTLNGCDVVLAKTGVGKVNAAMTVTLILEKYHPDSVIFTGIAGGLNPDLLPGDIVIGEKLAQQDFGDMSEDGFVVKGTRNPVDGVINPVLFLSNAHLVDLADKAAGKTVLEKSTINEEKRAPRVCRGVIVTGDMFVASSVKKKELRERFQADAVEMEGAAVAQVCFQQKVPFLVIRSLSDNADAKASQDAAKFATTSANNSARLVMTLLGLLNEGCVK